MTIHKEGHKIIRNLLIFLIIINIGIHFTSLSKVSQLSILGLSALILAFVTRFFRTPARNTPLSANNILCPADGRIVAIEETTEDEHFKDKMIQISIFMSIWNVHVNWHPIEGTIEYYKHHQGKFRLAKHPKSSLENERASVAIRKNENQAIMVRQIAGVAARRIITYAEKNKRVNQSDQVGIIKFGSRVDIFLPVDVKIKVKLKDKVIAKKTILATWT
ncbi:MAG: phosphatidylserine decarboxylase family protein [Bacteroidales bacterium]